MKTLGTLVVALALALSVQTAHAHIVQFVTALPMTAVNGVQDEAAVGAIILTAVKDGLRQAVAFTPSWWSSRTRAWSAVTSISASSPRTARGRPRCRSWTTRGPPWSAVTSCDAPPGGVLVELVGAAEAVP